MHTKRRAPGLLAAVALAALLGAACQPTPAPTPKPTAPPATTSVACPAGGSIVVATSIASDVKALLAAAKADRLSLCGGGYRNMDRQIALRKQNCGPSQYDIWQKPSRECNPPTAIPGTSMHEKGLAIDFDSCSTRSTACYRWLAANAARFGLKNLPAEPWHWSTNGH